MPSPSRSGSSHEDPDRLLAIYLNDHLAGATGGAKLAHRLRASNPGEEWSGPLSSVCEEIEADRATLERVMAHLRIRRGRFKRIGAWCLEKIGRLKPNGRLVSYSPLSRLMELELLCIGITGKLRLWRALDKALGHQSEFDFDELARRACGQREAIEVLHAKAALVAFAPADSPH